MPSMENRQSQGKEREIIECVKESILYSFPHPKKAITSKNVHCIEANNFTGVVVFMFIVKQNVQDALQIFQEAAQWLVRNNIPLWNPQDFENGKFLKTIDQKNLFVAYSENKPAAAMVLQWEDPVLWPHDLNNAGYIHKLSVNRQYAGKGIAQWFVGWAIEQVRSRKRLFLRLDCEANRQKLCKIYEKMGFTQVKRRIIGLYDLALYEMQL
jgi:ribosomal protein S18 acetylase RimI-like enzyme